MVLRLVAKRLAPLAAILLTTATLGCRANDPRAALPLKEEGDPPHTQRGTPSDVAGGEAAARAAEKNADSAAWVKIANETHGFVVRELLTPHGSYRIVPGDPHSDEWHDVSQVSADATMLALGEAGYATYVDATYAFVDKLWDRSSAAGGYFPRAAIDGSSVEAKTKYVDDNALSGIAWLDARDAVADPKKQEMLVASAQAIANFLTTGAVWDTTYDGGFWWNTDHPDKPTQTNGLALQLFLRLAAVTGEAVYLEWANKVLSWLEGTLFDPKDGLYAWKWEVTGRNDAKFSYDQAILIDAYVLHFKQTKDRVYLDRARGVAEAMHTALWAKEGGYVISTVDRRLSPVYSAWASCSLVSLYAVDPSPKWLSRAKQNASAINKLLRDPEHHGYRSAGRPDGTDVESATQSVDQAWMQRAQAMIANALRE